MNKSGLVEAVQEIIGDDCSKASAEKAVTAVLEGIIQGVKNDGDVQIIGFGTFSVVQRAARTGVNPKTKEKIKIPASKAVKFKAGSKLKDAV
jgi:DNA-binding protein HU-beta